MSPTIRNQATLAAIALAAVMAFTAFGTGTALAISPSEQECLDAGGTPIKESGQPNKGCDLPEEKVGKQPDHSKGQTFDKDETWQGNNTNKFEEECTGNPGHCKK